MPIPFHDLGGDHPDVAVAYLRFVGKSRGGNIQGALFVVSARGDPLEFCFTRANLPSGSLWHPGQAYRQAVAALSRALFDAVEHLPNLVLALAEETPSEVFSEDVAVQVPLCLVGTQAEVVGEVPDIESAGGGPVSLRWVTEEPSDNSQLGPLVDSLRSRRLLLEPFERAAQGLEEAFGGS